VFFRTRHLTRLDYSRAVFLEPLTVRLRPRSDCTQRLLDFDMHVEPAPTGRSECLGAEGNTETLLWFEGHHASLTITATSTVETLRANPFDHIVTEPHALRLPMDYPGGLGVALEAHRRPSAPSSEVNEFAQSTLRDCDGQTQSFLSTLTSRIWETFEKTVREEGAPQPPSQTLARRSGACRDLTVLFMDTCRALGLAARFVSGYHEGDPDEPENHLHAWAEVYLLGGGWRGFDPTLGLAVADRHVALAAGIDSEGAAPTTGTFRATGATSKLVSDLTLHSAERPGDLS
jgi:transglutaminase-like putative cysteine protease